MRAEILGKLNSVPSAERVPEAYGPFPKPLVLVTVEEPNAPLGKWVDNTRRGPGQLWSFAPSYALTLLPVAM